jgi:urease accessory protein
LPSAYSRLCFHKCGQVTTLVASHAEVPLVVQRPLRGPSGQAVVVVLTPAGALFDGDDVHLTIECGPGCDVTLATAAATRLNRCEHGEIHFELDATVAPGATLRYLPHELIPFRAARYRQRLLVALQGSARAMLLEVIAPGRSGEPFAYTRLEFDTEVRLDGALVVRERFVVADQVGARQHGHTHYGSLLVLDGVDAGRAAEDAAASLAAAGACAGATVLPAAGIGLKMLGDSALSVRQTLLQAVGCERWLTDLVLA